MSSVMVTPTQRIPAVVKQEVKDLLTPFFTRDYSDDVRNPVLLLNFLYQHSVISQPVYNICADPTNSVGFVGSCSLAPLSSEDGVASCAVPALEVEAKASSKRECKNIAAQKILNLLLENEMMNLMNDDDNREQQIDLGLQRMNIDIDDEYYYYFDKPAVPQCAFETAENLHADEKFYEDDLTGILLFDSFDLDLKSERTKRKRKKRSKKSKQTAAIVADPQCGGELPSSVASNAMEGVQGSFSSGRRRTSQGSMGSIDSVTLKELSSATTLGRWLADDAPAAKTPRLSSSRSRRSRGGKKAGSSSSLSSMNGKKMGSSSSLSSCSLSSASSSSSGCSDSSASSTRSYKVPFLDDVYEDFFDPFAKLRPKIIHYLNTHQSENVASQGGSATNETADGQVKFPIEFCQSNKTPFQILQEKAVKNFKLIPRSRIEKVGDGFSCTLILDANTGHGVGRTKKEAKVKAAIHVLQQLDDMKQTIKTEN